MSPKQKHLLPLLVPLGVALVYSALATAGLPWPAFDEDWLRDPGATLYFEGRLANPAITGFFPEVERIYVHYPPGYFVCFAAWCHAFGFGVVQARFFDLAIHLGAMLAVYALARRLAPEAGPAALALALLAYLPYRDQGRTDELAATFGVLMLIGILGLPGRIHLVLTGLAAALLGVTSWPMAIAFTLIGLALFARRVRAQGRPVLVSGLLAGTLAVLLGASVLGPLLVRHWDLLWLQAGADAAEVVSWSDPGRIIRWWWQNSKTNRYLLPVWIVAIPAVACVLAATRDRSPASRERRALGIAGAAAAVLIILNLPNGMNYLRALTTVLCAILPFVLGNLAQRPFASRAVAITLIVAVLLSQVPLVQNLVVFGRVMDVPAYGIEAAAERVRRHVPPGARVIASRNAYYFVRPLADRTYSFGWSRVPSGAADYACVDRNQLDYHTTPLNRASFLEDFERIEEGPPPVVVRLFGFRIKGDLVPLHAFDVWRRKKP